MKNQFFSWNGIQGAPHFHSGVTIRKLMFGLVVALLPPLGFGVYQYGMGALLLIGVSVISAVCVELLVDVTAYRRKTRIFNFHAAVVGLLVAAMLPPGCPLAIAMVGAGLAILLGKAPFGSLGGSFIAPAILGMLILFVSWPQSANQWQFPHESADYNGKYVAESPLQAVYADPSDEYEYSPIKMFLGVNNVGPIGAGSGLALLVGALWLVFMRITRMYATLGYMTGVVIAAGILGAMYPEEPSVWFHLASGYALFAAVFLVNDIPASPVTEPGMVLFGLLSGALTIVLRFAGVELGAALFAVAFSSMAVPFFDKLQAKPAFKSEVPHA
ncbi:MAG: RnfABCDGE type electron transport complex subunit D [Deltaproteobacteria bacterium]|nr:RnfABCDGE type electron transport complex subunit D [Deltaproteobacteria bacterium]